MISSLTLVLSFAFQSLQGFAAESKIYSSEGQKFSFEIIKQQEDVVWGFDFLPDGRILFTERKGQLKIIDPKTKKVTDISGTPPVWARGQGGLLDVRIHPKENNKIYFSYSEPAGKGATTSLAMAQLSGNSLSGVKKIFTAHEANTNEIHFGSRIEFDGSGHLFLSIGDRNSRDQVQDLSFHIGKLIRLKEDGTVPEDNPFVKTKGAKPEIWTLGHRSPQGLVRNPSNGDLWLVEMGPRGGDELNLIIKGKNYGWPEVTYGSEYWGPKIGVKSKKGMEEPVTYWVPSISPSGSTIYSGKVFKKWEGNLFLGTLGSVHLRRLVLKDNKVIKQEELLKDLGLRIRNVRTGPDGLLYLSTDQGHLARLVPVQ